MDPQVPLRGAESTQRRSRDLGLTVVAWLAPFGLALLVALELARPFAAGPVAFDSAASVLHFERITAGVRLEGFVSTTPKPLLTVVYGVLHGAVPDWRVVSWAAILAFALAVAVAANLALRLGGPLAWAFAGVAMAGMPALLFDTGLALGSPWALLFWAVAAWSVTLDRPRWTVAGIALALATLVRLETVVIVGVAALALVVVRFGPARVRRPVPRGAWAILLGSLAFPVMLVHDQLLIGDPLFWATVAARYTEGTRLHVLTAPELLWLMATRYAGMGGLVVLAVVGWLRLWLGRQRVLAVGLLGLGPGIAAFLVLLAARGTFVSDRYLAAVDVALAFAAAFSLPAIRVDLPAVTVPIRLRSLRMPALIAAAGAVAVLTVGAWGPLATDVRVAVRRQLWMSRNEVLVLPALRQAQAASRPGGPTPWLSAPTPLRPHLLVDLGERLPNVVSVDPKGVDLAGGYPAVGQVIYYDEVATGHPDAFAPIMVERPTAAGGVLVVPLATDTARRYWVVRIESP